MEERTSKPDLIRFGEFELDLRTTQLRKGGVLTKLQPQPAKVLALLASRPGSLLSRDEIRREVWGDQTFVDFEQGLNFCIRQIRTVLGDDADTPQFIETLPKRGYRFVATVEVAHPCPKPPQASILRVGVMPFQYLGADTEQDFFSEGLMEEMITTLSRLAPGRLRVMARTTMIQSQRGGMDLDRLRRELRIDYLLEGSIRRSANRLRIAVELIDVSDHTLVWADTYERQITDLFAIQSDVATRVGRSLGVELLPDASLWRSGVAARSPAHEPYLKGRYFWHKMTAESLAVSSRCFEEAIRLDPEYAAAYAGLADCYAQMGSIRVLLLSSEEALAKSKPMANRALELDASLPEGHNALALIRSWYEYDWAGAEAEFRTALTLDPDNVSHAPWYSVLLAALGESEKALAEIYRAQKIDPLSPIIGTYVGVVQMLVGQHDLAVRQLRQSIAIDPSYYRTFLFLGRTLGELGRYEEALAALSEAEERAPENLEAVAFRGDIQAQRGNREGATASLDRLVEMSGNGVSAAILIAVVHGALGNFDQAFDWLDRGIDCGANPMYLLRADSALKRLSFDPRYKSRLLRVGLPPYPSPPSQLS